MTSDWETGVPPLHVEFFNNGYFLSLNGLFLDSPVIRMFEGKDYRTIDMVLSIMRSHIDRVTGF